MFPHARLSNSFWAEATSAAVYVRNRPPTKALKGRETSHERWYGRKPDVSWVYGLRQFGRFNLNEEEEDAFRGLQIDGKGIYLFDEAN